ncbi:PEGA domain-containing protein, partial [bacterium]|nr:PEGA domain-containing protein [bacterium]
DACRDNPFKRSFRTESKGLAQMDAPKGTIIAYATSPGSVAADGPERNGIYTKHLLNHITRMELSVQELFNQTGMGVMQETGDKQVPWVSSTPIPRFHLAGGKAVVDQPQKTAIPKPSKGSLRVESSPPGAAVRIGGIKTGPSPVELIGLEPGPIKVNVTLEGYRPQEEVVYIRAGKETRLTLVLERLVTKGGIAIGSDPPGAKWYLNGAYAGTTPDKMKGLEPRAYDLKVKKYGYEAWSDRVEVRAGHEEAVQATLKAAQASNAGRPSEVWRESVTGMEFVWVPGGCYEMGCGSWTSDCDGDEKPVHEVCVDGFWMGKYEVTQGQWKLVMGSNPSHFKKGDNYPVELVSWNDAKGFKRKLSSMNRGKYTFRLPTEAEWEYACRSGGQPEEYAGGSDVDRVGWYLDNSGHSTHPVGTKTANGLGIYDPEIRKCLRKKCKNSTSIT